MKIASLRSVPLSCQCGAKEGRVTLTTLGEVDVRRMSTAAERADGARVKPAMFPLVLVCAGVLVLPTPLRGLLFGELAKAVNVIAWFGIILVPLSVKPRISVLRMKGAPILISLTLAALLAIGIPEETRSYLPLDLVAYVLPCLIVLYAGGRSLTSSARRFLPIWCWFLNFAVAIIALGGAVDMVADHAATRFMAELYGTRSFIALLDQGRMASFYGHALVSASIVIAAFCSNYLLGIVRRHRTPAFLLVLYVMAMALTTSKSGFILILAGIVLTSFRAGRLRNILIILIGLVAAYAYGLLDAVLKRLVEGYVSGDITTGRNSSLDELLGSGTLFFHLFKGQVFDSTNNELIAALEYPLLRFAFKYGIVFALLFAVVFFIYPLVVMLKRGQRRPLVAWAVMTVFTNGYSGIATYGDILLIQSITTMFALVVAREPTAMTATLSEEKFR